jgi:DNA-binding response OmpR family regulator
VREILIVSDADWVRREVAESVLDPDTTVRELAVGDDVLPGVRERLPSLVVLDEQIGSMGAMAVCMELRLEESAGRLPKLPVLILLDRRPDVFLAKRAGADGWVVKPLDPLRVRKAVNELLAGRHYFDEARKPLTIPPPGR